MIDQQRRIERLRRRFPNGPLYSPAIGPLVFLGAACTTFAMSSQDVTDPKLWAAAIAAGCLATVARLFPARTPS